MRKILKRVDNINLKFYSHRVDILVMTKNNLCYSLKSTYGKNKNPQLRYRSIALQKDL